MCQDIDSPLPRSAAAAAAAAPGLAADNIVQHCTEHRLLEYFICGDITCLFAHFNTPDVLHVHAVGHQLVRIPNEVLVLPPPLPLLLLYCPYHRELQCAAGGVLQVRRL
jgi:hypothetical protein